MSTKNKKTLKEKFLEFHEQNPHVYEQLVRLARQYVAKHKTSQIGIGMIYEVLRWDYMVITSTHAAVPYKLHNSHRAFYARLIMEQEPDLAGIFTVRTQPSQH